MGELAELGLDRVDMMLEGTPRKPVMLAEETSETQTMGLIISEKIERGDGLLKVH